MRWRTGRIDKLRDVHKDGCVGALSDIDDWTGSIDNNGSVKRRWTCQIRDWTCLIHDNCCIERRRTRHVHDWTCRIHNNCIVHHNCIIDNERLIGGTSEINNRTGIVDEYRCIGANG